MKIVEFCDGPNCWFSTRGVLRGRGAAIILDRFTYRCGQPGARSRLAARLCRSAQISNRLIESIFGDGTGQAIVGRAYQPPTPIYSEADPTTEPASSERAGARADFAAFPRATGSGCCGTARAQPPAGAGLLPVGARARRGAPQGRGPSTTSKRRRNLQSRRLRRHPAGGSFHKRRRRRKSTPQGSVASVSPGQLRGSQSQPAGYRTAAAPPAEPDPRYTGSITTQQVRTIQPTPANYRTAAAQPVQPGAQYAGSAPPQQVRGLFSPNYQVAAASQAAAYPQPGQYPQQPVRQQLASDTRRNRSGAMRIRRRPTLRRPMGTWRSSSR